MEKWSKGSKTPPPSSEEGAPNSEGPAQPVLGALILRNGKVVEVGLEEYRALGGEILLSEWGVQTTIIKDTSHAH